ncbi:hypothetical protein M8J77_014596 [Diaphorina citri]|nr:hypothetical protein M8J77_014596 [Diaphorina citri]
MQDCWDDFSYQLTTVSPLTILFDIVDYTLGASFVRDQLYVKRHYGMPLCCWLHSMLVIFASGILSNVLLGKSVLMPFQTVNVLLATCIWYLVFYSPCDIGYRVIQHSSVYTGLYILHEVHRYHKIDTRIQYVRQLFPDGYFIMVIVGTVSGNATGFARMLQDMVRGLWTPEHASVITKICLIASVVIIATSEVEVLALPYPMVELILISLFVWCRINIMLNPKFEPFERIEHTICHYLFYVSRRMSTHNLSAKQK